MNAIPTAVILMTGHGKRRSSIILLPACLVTMISTIAAISPTRVQSASITGLMSAFGAERMATAILAISGPVPRGQLDLLSSIQ